MKFFDLIFYNYYFFFKKRMPFDITPEFSTVIGISANLVFAIMGIIGVPMALVGKHAILFTTFFIGVGVFLCCYRYFMFSNKWKKILKAKPIIKSKSFSIAITVLFFCFGILCAICGPILMKHLFCQES